VRLRGTLPPDIRGGEGNGGARKNRKRGGGGPFGLEKLGGEVEKKRGNGEVGARVKFQGKN